VIGLPAPSVNDKELYAFHLLDKLLTEGKLSRLFRRLVEKEQLASVVTSEICETRDPFLFFIRVDVRKQSSLAAVESAVLEELTTLTQDIPTPEEFDRAKKQCTTHYLNDLETTSDQAFSIGLHETLNRLDVLTEYCERIEAVTPEDVALAASRYLRSNGAIVGSMPSGLQAAIHF
jgi:predicted Zn-dependent peptidase